MVQWLCVCPNDRSMPVMSLLKLDREILQDFSGVLLLSVLLGVVLVLKKQSGSTGSARRCCEMDLCQFWGLVGTR